MHEGIEDSQEFDETPAEELVGDSESSIEPDVDAPSPGDEAFPEFFSKEEFLSDILTELASLSADDFSDLSDEELKEKQCEGYARIRSILDTYSDEGGNEEEDAEGEEGTEDFDQDFSDELDAAGL